MKSSTLFILRIIWILLFGFSLGVVAYFQDKIPIIEKILILISIIVFFFTIFIIFLKSREEQESEWSKSALTPLDSIT